MKQFRPIGMGGLRVFNKEIQYISMFVDDCFNLDDQGKTVKNEVGLVVELFKNGVTIDAR